LFRTAHLPLRTGAFAEIYRSHTRSPHAQKCWTPISRSVRLMSITWLSLVSSLLVVIAPVQGAGGRADLEAVAAPAGLAAPSQAVSDQQTATAVQETGVSGLPVQETGVSGLPQRVQEPR